MWPFDIWSKKRKAARQKEEEIRKNREIYDKMQQKKKDENQNLLDNLFDSIKDLESSLVNESSNINDLEETFEKINSEYINYKSFCIKHFGEKRFLRGLNGIFAGSDGTDEQFDDIKFIKTILGEPHSISNDENNIKIFKYLDCENVFEFDEKGFLIESVRFENSNYKFRFQLLKDNLDRIKNEIVEKRNSLIIDSKELDMLKKKYKRAKQNY